MHLIALVFSLCFTFSFIAVVWCITRITTKWLEARVCTAQNALSTQQLQFAQKQHQDMLTMRREQMDLMSRAQDPFARVRDEESRRH